MQITKKNYKKITQSESLASIVMCKNDFKTIKILKDGKERLLHSKYDPVKEARAQTGEFFSKYPCRVTVIIFGLGMGYHLYEILKLLPKSGKISVFEPCPYVCRLFFENGGEALLEDIRIKFFTLAKTDSLNDYLPKVINIENCDVFSFYAPSSYASIFPEEHDLLVSSINKYTANLLVHRNSIDNFGLSWSFNFLLNYKFLFESAAVSGLFGLFKGKTAIIVSAGPSLSKNVRQLKNLSDKAVIICTDTAYRVLLKHEIKPHILVTVSGNNTAHTKLQGTEYNVPLVYKSQSSNKILEHHFGQKFYSNYVNDFLEDILIDAKIDAGFLDSGGSVACTSLDLAVKMGACKVIFIGQDLALSGGKAHSEHATSYLSNFDLENFVVEVPDVDGGRVKTLKNLNRYKIWIESYISKNKKVKYIDATEGGALISGAEIMPLAEALSEDSEQALFNVSGIIDGAFRQNRLLNERNAKIVSRAYKSSYNDYLKAKLLAKDIISKYNKTIPVSQEQVNEALEKICDYTQSIKYSILIKVFELKNMNIGKEPEKEIQVFYKILNILESLDTAYKKILEEYDV